MRGKGNFIVKSILVLIFIISCCSVDGQTMKEEFLNPPVSARPSTYWMWMNGNISKEGITADLEYMKRASYGGAMMFNVGVGIPRGNVDYASSAWNEMTEHAVKEASRLGLELFLQNSPGYSGTGGPWITPEHSMQQLVWTETLIKSNKKGKIDTFLPRPYAKMNYYQDAVVLAYPSLNCEKTAFHSLLKRVTLNDSCISSQILFDNDYKTQVRLKGKDDYLTFELSDSFEARSIIVFRGDREKPLDPHDGPRDYAPSLKLFVSDDGVNYREVAALNCPSLRAMDTPNTSRFPMVNARFYRLVTNRGTNISEVKLMSSDCLYDWPAKTNYVKDAVPLGLSKQHVDNDQLIDPASIVDITSYMKEDGHLQWNASQSSRLWTIVRIGSTTTGEVVGAAPDSGIGLDCDKFSAKALDIHFDSFMSPLLAKLKPWCGTTLKALMMDSWEAGKQNWTKDLPAFFQNKRGYDSTPWLLTMTGRIVKSIDATERFLYDMRRTQTDMFNENFLSHFKERIMPYSLKFAAEPYGDGNFESLEYAQHLDYPMSEFWVHYIYGGVSTSKMASSTAHLWNCPIVGAESFTGTPFNSKFTEHPYALKAEGDYMMTVGINRFVYHVFAHQPYNGPSARSIMTMGPFGTHLDRNSSWAEQAAGYNIYNSRCSYLLQQGKFVADILYIKDEGISSGINDYDITKPVTPYGYRWDIGGCDVLQRIKVANGILVLPNGMNYRLLVFPSLKMCSPEMLKQILRLQSQGATIVLPVDMPEGYMGMDESKDQEIRTLANTIWRMSGNGQIYLTNDLEQVIKTKKIIPDFSFKVVNEDARIHFIHRKVNSEDLYFITNHRRRVERVTASFRVHDKVPVLWNAETGQTNIPVEYEMGDSITKITFSLSESGSVFVIFRSEKDFIRCSSHFKEVVPVPVLAKPLFDTFTLSMWAKPETYAAAGRGFLLFPDEGEKKYGKGHAAVGLSMGQNCVRVYERSLSNKEVLETAQPMEGWTHIALVYENNRPFLYINGKLVAEGKKSMYVCSPACDVPMAEEQYLASFEGDQTDIKYSERALSPVEIADEVSKGLPDTRLPQGSSVLCTLNDDWKVNFPVWSKITKDVVLPKLISLRLHKDFDVKHFSGTCTYKKTFVLKKADIKGHNEMILDLGRVENIASVSVNGSVPVLLWKPPYSLSIISMLKEGNNVLEINITNLYPNRMIGDEYLPEKYGYDTYGRIIQFPSWYVSQKEEPDRVRVLFSPWKYYKKTDPLLDSGLLGPVRIYSK